MLTTWNDHSKYASHLNHSFYFVQLNMTIFNGTVTVGYSMNSEKIIGSALGAFLILITVPIVTICCCDMKKSKKNSSVTYTDTYYDEPAPAE